MNKLDQIIKAQEEIMRKYLTVEGNVERMALVDTFIALGHEFKFELLKQQRNKYL